MTTFISYSRKNSDFAVRLAKDLKAAGIDVWLDQLDIPTGARWDDEIEKALDQSSIFLIVLSPESIQSQNVKDEVGYAIDAGKRILPVTVENCNIPFRLRRFQYVDFSNKSYEDSLIEIKRLLTSPFTDVDDNERKQQKQRRRLDNKTLVMLTSVLLIFVILVFGIGLFGLGQMGIGPFAQKEAPTAHPATAANLLIAPTQPMPTTTVQIPSVFVTATSAIVTIPPQTSTNVSDLLTERLPTLQEINSGTPPSIWITNNIDVRDMAKPGTDTYSGKVQKGREYLLPIYWCTTSLELLDENMQSISMQFFVNNEQIPNEYIRNYIDDSSKSWKCNYHSVILSGWNENMQYVLEIRRTLSQRLFDGQSHYPAGTYIYKLMVNVQ
jgi:hypothetical protein